MELREYQKKARDAVYDEFRSGARSTLVVKPTGTGKTILFSSIASDYRKAGHKPVLLLAHRGELLEQAKKAFERQGLFCRIEKAEERAAGRYCDVVVASVQSLSREDRLNQYPNDYFSLIITDEAHHAVSSTYRKIYAYFNTALHLGVTATPNRHDEIGLKNIFESCAFQYSIQDAIKDGWLAPIRGKQIAVEGIHLEDVRIVAGDFSQKEMDEMLRQEATLQEMVVPTLREAEDRPTIVFTPSIEHAEEISACFNRLKPGSATYVHGQLSDEKRRENLALYTSGKRQFIANVGILTEGFDHPPTACIAFFRPTRSLGLFAQCLGRGTRLSENYPDCLVLDFVGLDNTVRTVTVMDVLDGTVLNDAEHKKAQEFQAQGDDAIDALAKAKQFVANLDSVRAKMRALTTAKAFDVMQMFAIPSAKGLYGGDKATDKQIAYLTRVGIKCPMDLEKGEASKLIERLINRANERLATFKQIRYLKQLGFRDNFIEQMTFDEASAKIEELVRNRGKRTHATV